MDPTGRIIAAIEGFELDRVPTMSILTDLSPAYQILGFPRLTDADIVQRWWGKILLNHFGMRWPGRLFLRSDMEKAVIIPLKAAITLGFDAAWCVYAPTFSRFPDSRTLQDDWGTHNQIQYDSYGIGTYMYREPKIQTREAYQSWPYFPNTDKIAKQVYHFYKRIVTQYNHKICICGEVVSDLYDRIQLALGFRNLVLALRKDPNFVQDFISRLEEFAIKTTKAMMDAGVKVIFKGDDFSFKTGPQMNPKVFDTFWGPAYTRLCQLVHERGGKIFLHSCGDNTEMFDYFIKWGFDGGHAFETTSHVDIFREKRRIGGKFTIIGGIGVDYLLTSQSNPEEVVNKVHQLITQLGPGGRFILAPVHSLPIVDMTKEKLMIETAKSFKL
jgi:uroporphyrinogen decarboxylase